MLLTGKSEQPIYRLRAAIVEDSYGDTSEDWRNPGRVPIRGASAQTVSTDETEGVARRVLEDERVLYVPRREDLTAEDRIEVDGDVWRIDGDPIVRRGLASAAYTTAKLRRITGG